MNDLDLEDYICISCETFGDDERWRWNGCPSCQCKEIDTLVWEDAPEIDEPELVAFFGEADHGFEG